MRAWAGLVMALGVAACAGADRTGPPDIPTPGPEQVPEPPAMAFDTVWQPGHFDWTGTAFVWQSGAWVPLAGHGSLWQDGYWERLMSGYAWVPGHWR